MADAPPSRLFSDRGGTIVAAAEAGLYVDQLAISDIMKALGVTAISTLPNATRRGWPTGSFNGFVTSVSRSR